MIRVRNVAPFLLVTQTAIGNLLVLKPQQEMVLQGNELPLSFQKSLERGYIEFQKFPNSCNWKKEGF